MVVSVVISMKTNFNSFLYKLMLQIDFGFPKTKHKL